MRDVPLIPLAMLRPISALYHTERGGSMRPFCKRAALIAIVLSFAPIAYGGTISNFFQDSDGRIWWGSQANNRVGYFYPAGSPHSKMASVAKAN
jgi:hypothetical protein